MEEILMKANDLRNLGEFESDLLRSVLLMAIAEESGAVYNA